MRIYEIENTSDAVFAKYDKQIQFAVQKHKSSGAAIYKGGQSLSMSSFIDPMAFPTDRVSANTKNYYTLWMDNSAKWAGFPKRGRSLICTGSAATAIGYGKVSVIIPVTDTAVGVCPKDDLWYSFTESMPSKSYTLKELNDFIDDAFYENDIRVSKTLTFAELRQNLNSVDLDKIQSTRMNSSFLKMAKDLGGIGPMMDDILDPSANGFELTSWSKYGNDENKEVWFSTPCVIIPINTWYKLLSDEGK